MTAGAGICAELGIPMTHRGVATSVRFLTGHSRAAGQVQLDESICAAGDPHTTLIVYMGLKMLPQLTQQLTGARLSLPVSLSRLVRRLWYPALVPDCVALCAAYSAPAGLRSQQDMNMGTQRGWAVRPSGLCCARAPC